jgi:phytoene dehydrogenase-like protein
MKTANVIGAGVNGLSAAIVLAQAGVRVTVWEAQATPGGAARTLPLTLPGFHHDFGAAVLPMAAGSPFLTQLPLQNYGLEWIHPPAPLAHPLDGGEAILLERDLDAACAGLGEDGAAWRRLVGPFVPRWGQLAREILQPPLHIPRSPLLMARFGLRAMQPATWIARRFRRESTRALWAGIAAHSFLPLDAWGSSAAGLALAIAGHSVGWPMARGGTQSLTNALVAHLQSLGGEVLPGSAIESLQQLPAADVTLCDVTPRQLLQLSGTSNTLVPSYISKLQRFRPGPGSFKLDYALSQPIPWAAPQCSRALTVHLGGRFEEIAASEKAMSQGHFCDQPFVLLAQPTLFDPTRAPAGKHIAWAYCHVPHGFAGDATEQIGAQIERFAPGFRQTVLARSVLSPAGLAAHDANLHGGDISGGAMDLPQVFFRPSARSYATSDPALWLCSSSTSPGGGVHGMCGANAAARALRQLG